MAGTRKEPVGARGAAKRPPAGVNPSEARVARLNQVLRALRAVAHVISRETDVDVLVMKTCAALIETGGYSTAWIALVDPDTGSVRGGQSGVQCDFDAFLKMLRTGPRPSCVSAALDGPDVIVIRDRAAFCGDCMIHRLRVGAGAMAVRLEHEGRIYGVLTVSCSGEVLGDADEVALLKDVASDVAFAVRNLEADVKRRWVEDALRGSEERFRTLFDDSPIALYEADLTRVKAEVDRLAAEGGRDLAAHFEARPEEVARVSLLARTVQVNKAFVSLFRAPGRDEAVARLHDIYGGRSLRFLREGLVGLAAGGISSQGELETRTFDGGRKWVQIRFSLVAGCEATWDRMLVTVLDLTQRRQTDQELAFQIEVHAVLAELSRVLLVAGTREEIADKVLEAARRLTASPLGFAGYVDERTGAFVVPTMTREVWDQCRMRDRRFVFRDLGGLVGWVLENREPVLSNDPASDPRSKGVPVGHVPIARVVAVPAASEDRLLGMLAVANSTREYTQRDLDALQRIAMLYAIAAKRREADERLQDSLSDLARSNHELEAFAYVASHDLQEPLRMVASYLTLLSRRYKGRLDGDADEFIGYAVDGAKRMQGLINDLLTYSRVGMKPGELHLIDCGEIVSSTLANLATSIRDSGALVTCEVLPVLQADETQMRQLFQNLIANALKFRGEQPPEVHVSAKRQGDEWVFAVRDNGIGIEPQYRDKVFGLFQRLHKRGEYPGTGIGLAICKKVVERHRGRIWVESEPGHGATFLFTLPAKTTG